MKRTSSKPFSPGFRLSFMDVGILAGGAIVASALVRVDFWIGVAVGFVVGHFFLFCNVLRMSRGPELIWAGVFVALAGAAIWGVIAWPWVFVASGVITAVLAGVEMRRACYHGVGWRRINPVLPQWWAKRTGDVEWRFDEPEDCAVITLQGILSGGAPVLYVSHDEDGGWQFLSGGVARESDAAVAGLGEIVKGDGTLKELADLPGGWFAERARVGEAWRRARKK